MLDKTLIGTKDISIYKTATDGAEPFGIVKKGQPIGTVYSYLEPKPPIRLGLWWMFYDSNNNVYYVPHEIGAFSTTALKQQGVITEIEKREAEAKANETITDKVEKYAKYIIIGVLGIYALGTILKNTKK